MGIGEQVSWYQFACHQQGIRYDLYKFHFHDFAFNSGTLKDRTARKLLWEEIMIPPPSFFISTDPYSMQVFTVITKFCLHYYIYLIAKNMQLIDVMASAYGTDSPLSQKVM